MTLLLILTISALILVIAAVLIIYCYKRQEKLDTLLGELPKEEVQHYTIEYHSDIKRWQAKYRGKYIQYRVYIGYSALSCLSTIETRTLRGIKQKIYEHYLKTHQPAKLFNIKGEEITLK